MTPTTHQWTLAFAAALASHALVAVTLPQALSRRPGDPPPPKPVLVSLATPPAPALRTPAVTPPAPPRPTPPVARQPEPPVPSPTPEVVSPQPVPAPAINQQTPLTQPSVAAVNPTPVAPPQASPSASTAAVRDDNRPPVQEAAPATPTTAAAPTAVLDTVDLAQLQSRYGKTAHHWLNRHKRYPRRAEYRGDEGTVLVKFVVNRHGEVLSYGLERSSGNTLLDKEALALIQRAQPLPVFPNELAEVKDTITVFVTIPFQLR